MCACVVLLCPNVLLVYCVLCVVLCSPLYRESRERESSSTKGVGVSNIQELLRAYQPNSLYNRKKGSFIEGALSHILEMIHLFFQNKKASPNPHPKNKKLKLSYSAFCVFTRKKPSMRVVCHPTAVVIMPNIARGSM